MPALRLSYVMCYLLVLLHQTAGVMLERAGATAVVPEILEPSLQLAAAVLSQVRELVQRASPSRSLPACLPASQTIL